MHAGGDPGTIYRFDVDGVAHTPIRTSLHEMDLVATLRFLTNGHRPDITVLGVEPETIAAGLDLSPSVRAAMPTLVAAGQKLVTQWRVCGRMSAVAQVSYTCPSWS
jgi:hydrogenase maturation protease